MFLSPLLCTVEVLNSATVPRAIQFLYPIISFMSRACCLKLEACCFFRMFLRIILKCLLLKSATSESAVATLGACKAPPIPSVALFTIPAVNTASLIAPAQQKEVQPSVFPMTNRKDAF